MFVGSLKFAYPEALEIAEGNSEFGNGYFLAEILSGEDLPSEENDLQSYALWVSLFRMYAARSGVEIRRDAEGELLPPESTTLVDFGQDVYEMQADIDDSTDEFYVVAELANLQSRLLVSDPDGENVSVYFFPDRYLQTVFAPEAGSSLEDGSILQGWLGTNSSGDVTFVDKETRTSAVLVEDTGGDGRALGTTLDGVPLFIADGGIYSFDAESRMATRMFDAGSCALDTSMMARLVSELFFACPSGSGLEFWRLPVGLQTTMPAFTVAGVDTNASASIGVAGDRVVYSARFSAEAERRIESRTLDGLDPAVLFAGSETPAFLQNNAFMSLGRAWMYMNTGQMGADLGDAHAIRVDGTDWISFGDARWGGAIVEPTLEGPELVMPVRLQGPPGTMREVIGVDAEDPRSADRWFGYAPPDVTSMDFGYEIGLPALATVDLSGRNDRDMFVLRRLDDMPAYGDFRRLTDTPEKSEARFEVDGSRTRWNGESFSYTRSNTPVTFLGF